MMKIKFKHSIWLAAGLSLGLLAGGCAGNGEERKVDYGSPALQPLEVPPDLVPPADNQAVVAPELLGKTPQETAPVLPQHPQVRFERAGTQRWLLVQAPADKVWSEVQAFLTDQGLAIVNENPTTGVMETDWAENRARLPSGTLQQYLGRIFPRAVSSDLKDKFRIRLERGAEPGTTEIYLSHHGAEQVLEESRTDSAKVGWRARPADPEIEAEMLRLLAARLGGPEEPRQAEADEGARIVRDGPDGPVLLVEDNLERVWRRVGLALDRVNFVVEDRDRAQSAYRVRYNLPAENEKGFWADLFDKEETRPDAPQYRVVLREAAGGTEVRVLNMKGAPERSETGERILVLLHEQLK